METRQTWTVDSIEEGVAAVDAGGSMVRLPLWLLPEGVREGDVLSVVRETAQGRVTLGVRSDPGATAAALRRSAWQIGSKAPQRDPGGDIAL